MFLDELLRKLRRLPYDEQRLFIEMNELILDRYKKNCNSVGREKALMNVQMILDIVRSSVIENCGDFQKRK